MAKLQSIAAVNVPNESTSILTVSPDTPFTKISELIIANHTSEQVSCKVSILKYDLALEVVVIPQLTLIAYESKIIPTSTNLNSNDQIIIEPNVNKAIDVLVSFVEM